MDKKDICKRYNIPENVAKHYRTVCRTDGLSDEDINRMGMLMTFYDAGFSEEETERFTELFKSGRFNECDKMLKKLRGELLEKIHSLEIKIENIDYLRYKAKQRGV